MQKCIETLDALKYAVQSNCLFHIHSLFAGLGDMAVSNSIGSNIFDVLLGLGFPWALRTLIVSYGSVVTTVLMNLTYAPETQSQTTAKRE